MTFSDSSEATCSVSSLSSSGCSGGESETRSERNSVASLLDKLHPCSNTTKETNNIIVVMFDEMNYHYFESITWNNRGGSMA